MLPNVVKFHISHISLLCHPHDSSALSALLGKCSFILAYVVGWMDQCMGFREWPSCLCRVLRQQKGWKTVVYLSTELLIHTATSSLIEINAFTTKQHGH